MKSLRFQKVHAKDLLQRSREGADIPYRASRRCLSGVQTVWSREIFCPSERVRHPPARRLLRNCLADRLSLLHRLQCLLLVFDVEQDSALSLFQSRQSPRFPHSKEPVFLPVFDTLRSPKFFDFLPAPRDHLPSPQVYHSEGSLRNRRQQTAAFLPMPPTAAPIGERSCL